MGDRFIGKVTSFGAVVLLSFLTVACSGSVAVGDLFDAPKPRAQPRLWAYSDKPFTGDVLSGIAGGRPFVSSVAPTGWHNSLRPDHMVQRVLRLGRSARRPFAREITGA